MFQNQGENSGFARDEVEHAQTFCGENEDRQEESLTLAGRLAIVGSLLSFRSVSFQWTDALVPCARLAHPAGESFDMPPKRFLEEVVFHLLPGREEFFDPILVLECILNMLLSEGFEFSMQSTEFSIGSVIILHLLFQALEERSPARMKVAFGLILLLEDLKQPRALFI